MKRSTLILLIDYIAFIGFIFLTSSGILLHYLLPPGSGRWAEVWSMNRHEWGYIHFWISVIFFSVLSLHLLFHWKVIINLLKGRHSEESGMRAGLGIIGAATIVLIAISPLISPVNEPERSGSSMHQHRGSKH